jgi:hypothetical protein
MTTELRWCAVLNPPGWDRPEWYRSGALAGDGTVFIPAAIASGYAAGRQGEDRVLLMAASDGIPVVLDDGHLYAPAGWVASICPGMADVCALIERGVRNHFGVQL